MDFEYGCVTGNKFAFLDENEVEDPSDLLAQVALAKEAAEKSSKDSKKVDSKGKKVVAKGKSANDAKKQPLQSTDNSKKSGDKQDSGKKSFGDRPQKTGEMGKENSSNRGPRNDGQQRPDRRPRQEGEGGNFRNDRPPRQEGEGGFRGDRRPRHTGPRPEGEGGFRRPNRQVDADGNVIESAEGQEGFRGGYRGQRGGFRGGYRGQRREEESGEVRKFDRHSGSEKTGIKAVDKKDGAGKGNWGTATDEVVIEETMGEGAVEGGEGKDWAERVDENEEAKKEGEAPEEDVPNFMTLDEYKALKSQINKRNDFNIRRPGEGEDQSKWGKTYILPKKADEEDEEDEEEEEEEEDVEEEPEDVQKKDLIKSMQAAFKFESTQTGERGRGDRGRGGPRGGGRGDRRDFGGERREYRPKPEAAEAAAADSAAPVADAPATEAPADVTQSPAEKKGGFGFGGEKRFGGDRPQRGGQQGGRGGRGAGRGGPAGGRGSAGPKSAAPKFDDEKDFPTLGK